MSYRERRRRKDSRAKTPWELRKALAKSQGNHAAFTDLGRIVEHPGRKQDCEGCGHGRH